MSLQSPNAVLLSIKLIHCLRAHGIDDLIFEIALLRHEMVLLAPVTAVYTELTSVFKLSAKKLQRRHFFVIYNKTLNK